MTTRRKYDRAFKERAVKLSYERSSITELASELGVEFILTGFIVGGMNFRSMVM